MDNGKELIVGTQFFTSVWNESERSDEYAKFILLCSSNEYKQFR